MFDQFSQFYLQNLQFINGVASACSIIALVWLIITFIRNNARSIVVIQSRSIKVSKNAAHAYNVSIKGYDVEGSALFFDTWLIMNRTGRYLTEDDFAEECKIILNKTDEKNVIFKFDVVQTEHSGTCRLRQTANSIILDDIKIPKNAGLIITVDHDGNAGSFGVALKEFETRKKSFNEVSFTFLFFPVLFVALSILISMSLGRLFFEIEFFEALPPGLATAVSLLAMPVLFLGPLLMGGYVLDKFFRKQLAVLLRPNPIEREFSAIANKRQSA